VYGERIKVKGERKKVQGFKGSAVQGFIEIGSGTGTMGSGHGERINIKGLCSK
jgi:hypothetical protein